MTESSPFRETMADASPPGEQYLDDRTALAYVYDGMALRAVLYDRREVDRYRNTNLQISLTPAGERRLLGGGR